MHRKKSTARTCKRAESLLESDYISQLNKEKQDMQAEVSRDEHRWSLKQSSPLNIERETAKERRERHAEHLKYLMSSKREEMK